MHAICAALMLNVFANVDEAKSLPAEALPSAARRLGTVTAFGSAQLAVQYAVLYVSEPPNWRDFGNSTEPTWSKFSSNFRAKPVWQPDAFGGGGWRGYLQADGDGWGTNIVGHGLQGSEIYLRMRRNGFSWWAASLMGVAHSTVWEYGVEGWNETPSAWDLTYTPIGGAVLGELRYRVLRQGEDRWYVRALADPIGELVAAVR